MQRTLRASAFVVVVSVLSMGTASAQQIMDKLLAVHPNSAPGALTASARGDRLWVAEGGAIAFIETNAAASFPANQMQYESPKKILPVGSQAVLASALLLDPVTEDVVYIAGGRSGLWVMEADPNLATVNKAARIDDSVNGQGTPGLQKSRRWCNGLDVMTIDGENYLVAMFSKANGNRLRVYSLSEARDVVINNSTETGHELNPIQNVKILTNGTADDVEVLPIGVRGAQPFAFGFGIAVDNSETDEAYVYVALGSEGLVRVRFDATNLVLNPPPATVESGPAFGDGTFYATDMIYDPDIYGSTRVYENEQLAWLEPPFFTDVAVQESTMTQSGEHYLYATVDHIGWVRFDLSLPWAGNMPISHHEGIRYDQDSGGGNITTHVNLLKVDPDFPPPLEVHIATYARQIDVVESNGEAVIVTMTHQRVIRASLYAINEGYWMGYSGLPTGPFNWQALTQGRYPYTLMYKASTLPSAYSTPSTTSTANFAVLTRAGGCALQAVPISTPPDTVLVFAGEEQWTDVSNPPSGDFGIWSTFRFETGPWNGTPVRDPDVLVRGKEDRPGVYNFVIGTLRGHPDVFVKGLNDGGVVADGLLYLCNGNEFRTLPSPGDPMLGSFSFTGETRTQWDDANEPAIWIWSEMGVITPSVNDTFWSMTKFVPGADIDNLCTGPPTVMPTTEKRVYVEKVNDSYLQEPRGVLSGGTISESYDTFSGLELLFGTDSDTPEAVVVLDRAELEVRAELTNDGDGFPQGSARLRFITTHPEFGYVNLSDNFSHSYPKRLLSAQIARGDTLALGSFSPAIFERRSSGAVGTKWLLVVPSTSICVDPEAIAPGEMMHHAGWDALPEFAPHFTHGLLSVFDISTPGNLLSQVALPAEYHIAPDAKSSLFNVDILALNEDDDPEDLSNNEYYAFVTDFGGHLYVFDLTNADPIVSDSPNLRVISGAPFATWTPKDSVTDFLAPNNIWDVILDVDGGVVYVYISVQRLGIVVLEFDPGAALPEDRLIHQKLIQTGYRTTGMFLREKAGVKTLVVADHGAGIRLYEK